MIYVVVNHLFQKLLLRIRTMLTEMVVVNLGPHTHGLSLKITSPAFKSLAAKATLPTPSFESTTIAWLAPGKISIFLVNSEH